MPAEAFGFAHGVMSWFDSPRASPPKGRDCKAASSSSLETARSDANNSRCLLAGRKRTGKERCMSQIIAVKFNTDTTDECANQACGERRELTPRPGTEQEIHRPQFGAAAGAHDRRAFNPGEPHARGRAVFAGRALPDPVRARRGAAAERWVLTPAARGPYW